MKKVSLKRGIKPNKKACGRKNSTLSPQAEDIEYFYILFYCEGKLESGKKYKGKWFWRRDENLRQDLYLYR
jgi:hypothetical protein